MTAKTIIGRQIAAGRMLASVSQGKLAKRAGIAVMTLKLIEANDGPPSGLDAETTAVRVALEGLGVVLIDENGGGHGVRLKHTRSEVRQLQRLEGEGGIVADDDA